MDGQPVESRACQQPPLVRQEWVRKDKVIHPLGGVDSPR
jgi:hypothetical protein